MWHRAGSACFFGLSSMLIIFVNKLVLTNYKYLVQFAFLIRFIVKTFLGFPHFLLLVLAK